MPDATLDVVNPATEEVFDSAPLTDAADLDNVFDAAGIAFDSWRRNDALRRDRLDAAAGALEAAVEDLAPLLTTEQGKSLADSRVEISASAAWIRYYANFERPSGVVQDDSGGYQEVFHRPLGVVSAIVPWNFPVCLAAWKIAPALRAGNTIVVKPSPYTPLSTIEAARVMNSVLPPNVLTVVAGGDDLGAAMVSHPVPRKVSLTGSVATGKRVAAACVHDLKRVTLELGGNDAAIVLGDVDVAAIAEQLFWGAFLNNGQWCLAIKRVYADAHIHDDLVEALAAIANSVKVDDGTADGAQLGPINNRRQFERVDELVRDAIEHGARPAAGGHPLERRGYFFAPTVLDSVTDGVRVVDEEQFGPALPIVSVRDADDAVRRTNASPFGLTGSVWSADRDRALAVAAQVDTGQVAINSHGAGVQPHLPFGGHKQSGVGVENGVWGLDAYTELQVIAAPTG